MNLLSKILISNGYAKNPLDPCVFNKTVNGIQCTIIVYVDDLMITSTDMKLIDEITEVLRQEFKTITVHDGKVHSYFGMSFDFNEPGEVKITMSKYLEELVTTCNISGTADTPAANNLFDISETAPKLSKQQSDLFHSHVAKCLYVAKRVRPDILLAVSFLSSRVQCPDTSDWKKLIRILKYSRV